MMRAVVIIPTLNEERHIRDVLESVLRQATPQIIEILVVDGGSRDRTRAIVEEMEVFDSRIRFLQNSAQMQAAGVNLAASISDPRAEVIIRLDAHSKYPKHYISRLSSALEETGADSVVVRLRSVGQTCFQKAVAAASNSKLGTGGAAHRVGGVSGWIDHGHHAAFRRERFLSLGGYNEALRANEDAEYDARQRRLGGKIWFDSSLEITYFPRATPIRLVLQYGRYGFGRAQTLRHARQLPRLRQLASPLLVALLASCTTVGLCYPPLLSVLPAYVIACALYGLWLSLRESDACVALSGLAAVLMHLSWGIGFWRGVVSKPLPCTPKPIGCTHAFEQ